MSEDRKVFLNNKTLEGMAREAKKLEVASSLSGLQTSGGRNRAIFKRDGSYPDGELVFLPSPAVPPAGATKICDGRLTAEGQAIDITAFRRSV
ncbi:hypothetical protein [Qipengyuania sp.]|uniref:hypothetical protein n=1 Tax=Qipengyuania sp. TaxID=2004515 RepID=UPI00351569AA